jgi:proton glutamate symport protein
MFQIVILAILLAATLIAVFGLLAQICIQFGLEAIVGVGAYMDTLLLGLKLLLGLYLAIVTTLARRNPFAFLRQIWSAQLLAFSTSSSAAVMLFSMKTAEEDLGVSRSISQFIVPLGATLSSQTASIF